MHGAPRARYVGKVTMNVLVLNSGSSSLKFQLIATDLDRIAQNNDKRLCRGLIERIGGEAIIATHTRDDIKQKFTASLSDISSSLEYLVRWITSDESGITEVRSPSDIQAVGHRVVHGGELFTESTMITEEVLQGIEECIDLAPLHNPNNIKGILASRQVFGPKLPQVAVFDTSFHHSIPEHAYLYAVPYHLYRRHHIRRYGFHGTSHRYVTDRYRALRALTEEQTHVITLHLGNGCSATAIRGGRSVDTSMGMTPLDALLNTQSGLLGISGLTNDMRVLLQALSDQNDRQVRLAIEVFCYRARKYVGAFLACMGGADAIVFTGGIGENSPDIRARICEGLEWTGLRLDDNKNKQMVGLEGQISSDDSSLRAFVIPTDEELLIARDTVRCILGEPGEHRVAAAENSGVGEMTH
jgi:acetate kinase